MKRTPWFDGSVKPVHVGVYQRSDDGCVWFSHWNGSFWGCMADTRRRALFEALQPSYKQNLPWRGLTQPAEA